MNADADFLEVTRSYEAWRFGRIPVVAPDLERKHELLGSSPFVFLRGTYYRFLQAFPTALPEVFDAPRAVAVGDLHIENFGTWRDRDGRLAWGVNDLDEIDVLPYTVDLVRLATSVLLAIAEDHLALHPAAACQAIIDGWQEQVHGDVEPFVLGERHAHLAQLAAAAFTAPDQWARRLAGLAPYPHSLPAEARRLLDEVAPWPDWRPELRARTAGVGSLGSRRAVVLGELSGGLVVRELKQIPGPGSEWLDLDHDRETGLPRLVSAARGVAADPWRCQDAGWVARRLAPDATRIELTTLKHAHDHVPLLRCMGGEAANIHLTPAPGASPGNALRKDAKRRPGDWLHEAAHAMAVVTGRDHARWRARKG